MNPDKRSFSVAFTKSEGRATPERETKHVDQVKPVAARYGIGARLMQKMGYVEGQGLGKEGEGISVPIEVEQRPRGMGIGAQAHDEYSEEEEDIGEDEEDDLPSTFTLIHQLERLNLSVPDHVKMISDEKSSMTLRADLYELHQKWQDFDGEHKLYQHEVNEFEGSMSVAGKNIEWAKFLLENVQKLQQFLLGVQDNHEGDFFLLEEYGTLCEVLQNISHRARNLTGEEKSRAGEVMGAAIYPVFRGMMDQWDPLNFLQTEGLIDRLLKWKEIMAECDTVEFFENVIVEKWGPIISRVFSENWSPQRSNVCLHLMVEWEEVVPERFLYSVYDCVIIPLLVESIKATQWPIRDSCSLSWILDWLHHLNTRHSQAVVDALVEKFETHLLRCPVFELDSELPQVWKPLLGEKYEKLILDIFVPKILSTIKSSRLENELLRKVEDVLRETDPTGLDGEKRALILLGVYRSGVFPKWTSLLSSKLKNSVELAHWLSDWFGLIPNDVVEIFLQGIDYVNSHYGLGFVNYKVVKRFELQDKMILQESKEPSPAEPSRVPASRLITRFKDVVEDFCIHHSMMLFSTNKFDDITGLPLYKIVNTGKNTSVICYFDNDVLFAQIDNEFEPMGLEEIA